MTEGFITRREALSRLALIMGGALIGGQAYLAGTPIAGKSSSAVFSSAELNLMDEIGETIIPTTKTPGAKAVGIGGFMAMMVNECYEDRQHAIFKEGLRKIEAVVQSSHGKSFSACTSIHRTELLNQLDVEQRNYTARKARSEPEHYFRMMKQLTLLGYFTSEIGCTQALRYVETPGAYRDEPYQVGERAWFNPPPRSV